MNDAVDRLPERFRLAVWLHEGEGFSWREVGEVMGAPAWLARVYGRIGLSMLKGRMSAGAAREACEAGLPPMGAVALERAPAALVARIDDMARDWDAGCADCGPDEQGGAPAFAWSPDAPASSLWVAFATAVAILMSALTILNR